MQVLVVLGVELVLGVSLRAEEIRIVGGKRVDVEPVIEWLAHPKGERPLPHWKQIKVTECLGMIGQQTKCTVTVDGKSKTILLANLKPEIVKHFARLEYLKTYIPTETERLKQEELRLDQSHAATPAGKRQRARAKQDSTTLKHEKAALEERIKESKQLAGEVKNASDLAMSTGVNYAGLEVWDCGTRLHQSPGMTHSP